MLLNNINNMRWIKNRDKFISEAKIRDVIFPRQAKEISRNWGEKYLDYEEVVPTNKIKQGKWKLSEEDKLNVLGKFFDCDMGRVYEIFTNLPDKLADILFKSIDTSLLGRNKEKYEIILKDFNVKSPTVDQIVVLYDNIFRKLSVNDTKGTEMLQRDENGRPIRDGEGNMIKISKEEGDPIFSSNLVNINSFISDYNNCYPDASVTRGVFDSRDISNLRNLAKENHNSDYKVDFEIFNRDVYLQINHNPKDILNISISQFFSSCQHLYSGSYRNQLLGNVFDPNSIPAFLLFETPITWGEEKISEFLPLSRMFIRNIESFDDSSTTKIFFDRAYPDRMKDVFGEMVEKYSDNKEMDESPSYYYYTPDVELDDTKIRDPYMDRLNLRKMPYIGVNTKSLYLSRNYDWSNVKVSPNAKIKELVIETTDIPENLLKIKIELEWVKFRYLKINTLKNFENVKADAIAFDKCKLDNKILEDINTINNNIKKLQIVSCDISNFDVSMFANLEELQMIYTLDSIEDLENVLKNTKLEKLVISGDLIKNKDSKAFVNSLKSKMKVEIVGPVVI